MTDSSGLLERPQERGALLAAIDAAAEGRGSLVLVEGPAGAGKTSLLQLAGELARERGARLLAARGGELERDVPYGVIRQLLEEEVRGSKPLEGSAAMAAPVFGGGGAEDESTGPGTRHGLFWLVADLAAEAPLILLVDDVQWADADSLRALAYIVRRLDGLRTVIVAAIRAGEHGAADDLLAALRREAATRLVPAPLSADAARTIVAGTLGGDAAPGFCAACQEASGGNPFLLAELLQALRDAGLPATDENAGRVAEVASEGASATILLRLEALGGEAVAVARAVAVLDPAADLDDVAALCGLPVPDAVRACEALIAARLLTDAPQPAFVHPLVKEAVLHDMSAPRLAAMHLGAAERQRQARADPATVAAHLLRVPTGGRGWVVAALRDAARDALARGTPAVAVAHLERALAEPPDPAAEPHVREELGDALLDATDARGLDVLLAARAASSDPVRRGRMAVTLSMSLAIRGRAADGLACLSESIAELDGRDPDLASMLAGQRLASSIFAGIPVAWPDVRGELDAATAGTPGGRALMNAALIVLNCGLRPLDEAVAVADRLAADLAALERDARGNQLRINAGSAYALADRPEDALRVIAGQLSAARRRGVASAIALALTIRSLAHFLGGDLAEAEADAAEAMSIVDETALASGWTLQAAALVNVVLERGDAARANEFVQARGFGGVPPPGLLPTLVLSARARTRAALGRHTEARDDFREAGERLVTLPYADPELFGWREGLALALLALGDEAEARQLGSAAVDAARAARSPRAVGIALRAQGVTASDGGIDVLRESAEVLAATHARYQHAQSLVALGAALRRRSHRREAREPLREGLELAHVAGARGLAERARTELAAAGARPRSVMRSGVEALTPSEGRVARMAAGGLTNREIAQELFVTPKTVETQLRSAYRKLGIAGRRELGGALD